MLLDVRCNTTNETTKRNTIEQSGTLYIFAVCVDSTFAISPAVSHIAELWPVDVLHHQQVSPLTNKPGKLYCFRSSICWTIKCFSLECDMRNMTIIQNNANLCIVQCHIGLMTRICICRFDRVLRSLNFTKLSWYSIIGSRILVWISILIFFRYFKSIVRLFEFLLYYKL